MRVLIVRHGEAVDPYEAGTDAERWLTPNGRATMLGVGALLRENGVSFDHMFTSPLVRAVQTTELLARATGFEHAPRVWSALAGGTTAGALAALDEANDHPPNDEPDHTATVALVGHEPQVRTLASELLGRSVPGFRTGGTCVIDWDGRTGRFEMAIDAKLFRVVTRIDDIPT